MEKKLKIEYVISGYDAFLKTGEATPGDALGRLATQTETIGGATIEKAYAYDVRGRLTSVTTDGVVTEWYAYDLNGNRTNSMAGAATYDAQDRLLASGTATFTHDTNGNLVSKLLLPPSSLQTSYAYDLFGQLKSVTLPDGRVVSYDRDALNRVTAKRVNGAIVKGWIYKDALKPIAETDADGNVVSFFVYGASALSPDYMVRDGVTYRFIRDVQGSVRLVIDADTGAIAQRLDYDSFGRVLADTNPGFQPFGFQSGLYDPDTGLVQFGARWFDAATGRWLSKDPILLEGGLNLYAFCGNDPVNFVDPDGLDTYKINRKLDGDEARSKGNPVSHTFYAVQYQDGTIETYGWGSEFDANNNGLWSKNLPQDIKAATEAINNGKAWLKGDCSLDPFIEQAYNQLVSGLTLTAYPAFECRAITPA